MDKELEQRGLRFVRYVDDCNIFVKSGKSAKRVMKSITSWLERKLFLKVNTTKTKVVRPTKSKFLGFTFWKTGENWQAKPGDDRKAKLYDKIRELLSRHKAVAQTLSLVFTKINQVVKGWGAGVFGFNAKEVAKMWQKAFDTPTSISTLIYAVIPGRKNKDVVADFKDIFV